jgi:hypothetical protein
MQFQVPRDVPPGSESNQDGDRTQAELFFSALPSKTADPGAQIRYNEALEPLNEAINLSGKIVMRGGERARTPQKRNTCLTSRDA